MDVVIFLAFIAAFAAWGIWVSLRAEERKEAGEKKE